MKNQKKAYAYALLAVLCWATVASAFKLSLDHLGSDSLVLYSAGVALLFLGVYGSISRSFFELSRWRATDFVRSAILGGLNPFLYYVILFRAYDLLPAQEAQPLNFTWPIVLVVLSAVLFGQPIRLVSYLALLVSFCGVVVIATHGNPLDFRLSDPAGVTLALVSTIIWALYWLYSSNDERNPVNRLFVNFCFGFLYVLAYCAIFGTLELPDLHGMMGSVYIGLVEMGLAFVFWLKALRLSRTTAEVGSLIYLTPFLSLIVISIVVGEKILDATWLGLVLIIGGIVIQNRFAGGSRTGDVSK